MRAVPAGLATEIAKPAFRLATLIHIRRPDGEVYAFTTWDTPLLVDLLGEGAIWYSPAKMEGISAFSAQISAPPDDAEISVLTNVDVLADDVRRGFFQQAEIAVGYVNPGSQDIVGEGSTEGGMGELLLLLLEEV